MNFCWQALAIVHLDGRCTLCVFPAQKSGLESLWEQKEVTSRVIYVTLIKHSLRGSMVIPPKQHLPHFFLNKNIALGWISVKINIVLIKMLQGVGF